MPPTRRQPKRSCHAHIVSDSPNSPAPRATRESFAGQAVDLSRRRLRVSPGRNLPGSFAPITVIQRNPASALNRTFRQARLVTEMGGNATFVNKVLKPGQFNSMHQQATVEARCALAWRLKERSLFDRLWVRHYQAVRPKHGPKADLAALRASCTDALHGSAGVIATPC